MEPTTIAALDLGSNSFHLVIARVEDDQIIYLDRIRDHVCLADGLQADGSIRPDVQQRALESLSKFEHRLRDLPADAVRVVGTNTLRAAKNAREFLDRAEHVLCRPINVIAGMEEARLIYLGVARHLPVRNEIRLVTDIGGGSTELIIGHGEQPRTMESLHMGCVTYSKRFFANGQLTQKSITKAINTAQRELQPFRARFERRNWDHAIGASGTIKAIAGAIRCLGHQPDGITADGMDLLLDHLLAAGHTSKLAKLNLKDDRVDVFPGGFCVLYGMFAALGITRMAVSQYALREGLLIDIVGRFQQQDARSATVRSMMRQYRVSLRQAARVKKLALELLPQVTDHLTFDQETAEQFLQWAAYLHEIGLSISHSGYHKHGAYIVMHADMSGFSKREQDVISGLILNHRRKLRSQVSVYGAATDWALVLILRMACLFNRRRVTQEFPPISVRMSKSRIKIKLSRQWLSKNPLTEEDLNQERAHWKAVGFKFKIEPLD